MWVNILVIDTSCTCIKPPAEVYVPLCCHCLAKIRAHNLPKYGLTWTTTYHLHAMRCTLSSAWLAGVAFLTSSTRGQDSSSGVYDYIVVGSGPGGGPLASNLARAGHSVLLVEAGDNQSDNVHSEIVALSNLAYTDPALRWDFFVRNFANETHNRKHNHLTWRRPDGSFYVGQTPPSGSTLLGIFYPRGGTLGGSSAVNAMVTIYPSRSDWQHVVDITRDSTWR